MKFRTYYIAKDEARKGLVFLDKSLTRQEFLKESLTSTIIERFTQTGILNATVNPERVAMFGDFSEVPNDFFEASCRIKDMQSTFDSFPSDLRQKFNNSLGEFVAFISDDKNREKAVEFGLLPKPAAKPAEVKPDEPPPAS